MVAAFPEVLQQLRKEQQEVRRVYSRVLGSKGWAVGVKRI
jgi:hypothetical protein